jgi:hypothetical protein
MMRSNSPRWGKDVYSRVGHEKDVRSYGPPCITGNSCKRCPPRTLLPQQRQSTRCLARTVQFIAEEMKAVRKGSTAAQRE